MECSIRRNDSCIDLTAVRLSVMENWTSRMLLCFPAAAAGLLQCCWTRVASDWLLEVAAVLQDALGFLLAAGIEAGRCVPIQVADWLLGLAAVSAE